MAQIDSGPATGTAEIVFNLPGGPVVTGIEVHVPSGTPSLSPSSTPFVDPGQAGYSGQSPVVPVNKSTVFGVTGATVVFANPS